MKQKNNVWHFESHEELRNYLAQGIDGNCFDHHVYLSTLQIATVDMDGIITADTNEEGQPYVITKEDNEPAPRPLGSVYSRDYSIRAAIGHIDDYPAEDFAVKRPWQVVELEAPTVVEGFYKAGEHLAARCYTVGEERTQFTTKELTAVKNSVVLENFEELDYLYRIRTQTGFYQCHQDQLWQMMLAMEKAEGVGPARRRAFTIRKGNAEDKAVMLRLSFAIDKETARMKQCLANDELRPVMNHPVVETATGIMVATNGHILTAHKLQGYEQDAGGALPAWARGMLSVPREMLSMKGTVTIEVVEGKWEESVRKRDGSTEIREVTGIIITASDKTGRQAVLKAPEGFRYPNWRSVIPNRLGPAISIDTKALTDGVKRVMPQLSDCSEMVMMAASEGEAFLNLYGQDYDFSKSGTVKVDLPVKMPCGMRIGLKAPLVITAMGFEVTKMHYISADRALVFLGGDTLTLQMPMLDGDCKDSPTPPDEKMRKFDVGKWCEEKTPENAKPAAKAKAVSKKHAKPAASHEMAAPSHETTEPTLSLSDRLRAALRKQLAAA